MNYYLFLTNIYKDKAIHLMQKLLEHYFNTQEIDFHVTDKKSILKMKGKNLSPIKVESTLNDLGYRCKQVKD